MRNEQEIKAFPNYLMNEIMGGAYKQACPTKKFLKIFIISDLLLELMIGMPAFYTHSAMSRNPKRCHDKYALTRRFCPLEESMFKCLNGFNDRMLVTYGYKYPFSK